MINLQSYIINFGLLLWQKLPSVMRHSWHYVFGSVWGGPIVNLYASKQKWRAQTRYNLQHNGQVIYLEKVLNEYFEIAAYNHQDHQNTKEIYIGPGERLNPTYIYITPELQPVPLYTTAETTPLYIYTQAEIEAFYADFIVWVPASLLFIEDEMRAKIDYFIDTRYYKIKTY